MTLTKLLREMKQPYTAHGFRSAFRDWASEETDVQGEVAEAALAHMVRDKTEAAYRRGSLLEKRRKLMDDWSTYPCVAGDFLRHLAAAVPYRIHTVLTDNGTHFTDPTGDGWTPADINEMRAQKLPFRCHSFELACADLGIEHRLTKPRHPWTNGQVERMNRTIKEATVKRYHYETHDQLRQHLNDFVAAYNFARRLKTLRGLTPYEAICKAWTNEPERFISNPHHQSPGPNI
jgi:hypothetical protein